MEFKEISYIDIVNCFLETLDRFKVTSDCSNDKNFICEDDAYNHIMMLTFPETYNE